MDRELSRRALLAGLVGAGVAGASLPPARGYLDQFAPLSGSVWGAARSRPRGTVESPYGPAELRYDDDGVPHVSADDEEALYFAVGYTQGTDRLFQMDLQRRLFRGELAAVVGDLAVESDRFHRQMAFAEAAEATAEHLEGTPIAVATDAFAEGVNAAIENEELPLECRLLEYEPEPWRRADTALIEKLIAWQLTGSFRTLRVELVRERLGDLLSPSRAEELVDDLFPGRFEHDAPIIRDEHDAGEFRVDDGDGATASARRKPGGVDGGEARAPGKGLVDWLGRFESPPGTGSNSWVIGTEHTAGDAPIVANDPHLALQAPPTWYEMHLDGPDHRARGVTFPGAPVVVIGENDHGAWGFTNAGADVIDFYRYDGDGDGDGDVYEYGDERREFDVDVQEIEVADGPNEEVEVKKTVHGPVVEEADQRVAVAWTGHTATETTRSLYELSHSTGLDDVLAAAERFESPTQNLLYADREGGTLYYMTGRVPLRHVDGERVRGDRVFDGSAREAEWEGFEPFGRSTWEGFVPFSANPHVVDPGYLATANQQIVADDRLDYYLAGSYASPYRGERIYDLLDDRVDSGGDVDLEFLREVGRDTYDGRAAALVEPLVEAARDGDDPDLDEAADVLAEWDYHMDADSRAALVFDRWFETYREELLGETFEEADLDESYFPAAAAVVQLPRDSGWFGSRGRARVMRNALRETLDRLKEEGHEVYGDVNHTGHIAHPLGLDALGYPAHPRGGGGDTVWNYSRGGPWGGSWEMQADLDGDLLGVLPGGNSGRYFSGHYRDQLRRWADGEYRTLSRELEGELTTEFVEGGGR